MLSAVAVDAPEARATVGASRLSDELLARQSARGGERAFQSLYERYHQPLYQYCRSILHHDADAQDALQSTFAKALVAMREGQRSAPLRPWLYRIAHNEAISIIRSRRRDQLADAPVEEAGLAASAEEEVDAREVWSALLLDIAQLPEKQRGALLQRELSGLSHEEIGLSLGTSTGAAKQLIFEARQALAELAEGREMECAEVRRRISDGDRRVLRGRKVSSHLRGCAGCAAFAAAIPARSAELRAAIPLLAPVAAAELFGRAIRVAGTHGAAGASAAPAAGAAAGAAKLAGGGLLWKAIASGLILATAAVGVTKLAHRHHHHTAVPVHRTAAGGSREGGANAASSSPRHEGRTVRARGDHASARHRAHAGARHRAGRDHAVGLPAAGRSTGAGARKPSQANSRAPAVAPATPPAAGRHASGHGHAGTGGGEHSAPVSKHHQGESPGGEKPDEGTGGQGKGRREAHGRHKGDLLGGVVEHHGHQPGGEGRGAEHGHGPSQ